MQISHRIIQLTLKKALSPQEVWIEKSFSSIGRVADVVWPAQKLIFEVQCSPISVKEIKARQKDYQKLGYTVIWILHECHFNRCYLTSAERFLLSYPHYFTNIHPSGQGEIYDQFASIQWGRRLQRTPRYPIALSKPIRFKSSPQLKQRRKWKLGFSGDLLDQSFQPFPKKTKPIKLYLFLFHALLKNILR